MQLPKYIVDKRHDIDYIDLKILGFFSNYMIIMLQKIMNKIMFNMHKYRKIITQIFNLLSKQNQ